jgi:alpha-tubulin suppressor-like RCC1 family protein
MSWYRTWHGFKFYKQVHWLVLILFVFSVFSPIFSVPQNVYAAWNNTASWTTKADFENGTVLTNVATNGDNDEGDANNNDNLNLTSQADKKQTIAAGYNQSIILKSDGTVWGTGFNFEGNLGLNDQNPRMSWSQSSIDNVESIYNNGYASMAIKTDGTVWGTGYNPYGGLGVGDSTRRLTWVQEKVNSTTFFTNVKKVVPHMYHSIALKNDGTVWVTGYGYYGQLGFGDT